MTKDEALRIALDALEYHTEQTRPIQYTIAAIVKIKAALEANNKSVDFYGYCPICNAKGLSRERHPNGSDVCTNGHIYESKYALTTPPQRTWVGLTDEEVADIERNSITRRQAIRAIEAKLKEKNT
jgi:hypothetical protein